MGGGEERRGEGKQVEGSTDTILYIRQSTRLLYSGSVVRIYTCDVKQCGGPGWNTVNVINAQIVLFVSVHRKCPWNFNFIVLLQIKFFEKVSSVVQLWRGDSENVSLFTGYIAKYFTVCEC